MDKILSKKTISFSFLFFVFSLFFTHSAFAANYYVDATLGVDTALGTSSDAPWQTISKVNGITFVAGDNIYFKRGETWNDKLIIPSSGTAGNPITFGAYGIGADPIIDAQDIRTEAIYNNGKDYITIDHIHVKNGTDKNLENAGITDHVTISNVTSTGGVNGIWVTAGDGVLVDTCVINQGSQRGLVFYYSGTTYVTNSTIQNCIFNGIAGKTYTQATHFNGSVNLSFLNNEIYDWSLANASDYLYYFLNVNGLTIEDTVAGSTGHGNDGYNYYFNGCSNVVISDSSSYDSKDNLTFNFMNTTATLNNVVSDGGIFSAKGTSVLTINNSTFANNETSSGFNSVDSAAVVINNGIAYGNYEDGFSVNGTSVVTCNKCLAYNNGNTNSSTAGDGFTSHDTATFNVLNSVAYKNFKSGAAMAVGSSGTVYNNTFYDNYEKGPGDSGNWNGNIGIGFSSTGTWNVKNNITKNHEDEMLIHELAVAGGIQISSDYNIFDNSREANAFRYNAVDYNFADYKVASSGLESHSKNQDPLFTNTSTNNFALLYNSPAIDAGTDVSLTTDYLGNPMYGTPDIGAYEYQPPHNLTNNDTINIGAGARIYGDGKFRDLGTTSGSVASLKITPQSGTFTSYNATDTRPAWLDITNITTWTTSHKTWTESNALAGLTNTVHTVGDLEPNQYYYVKVDNITGQNITGANCNDGLCMSNAEGKIVFTYTGTYSTHIFDVSKMVDSGSHSGTYKEFREKFIQEQQTKIQPEIITTPSTPTSTPSFSSSNSTRTLKYKMTGNDVKGLQSYLNTHGYPVSLSGSGSLNHETTYFGLLTKKAVINFQKSNNLTPDGIVGPLTRGKMK
ncbi:MAG TPA: peptidoglycan-binding domain-containing protein [Candidatus Paceibacterota bacterium]|nr:peptidoglycan-binding domain-containing protein [Candidatus Paceibacterota bacterium]